MRLFALLSVAAFALAGCADSPPVKQDTENFDDLGLEAGTDTGIIRGIVIDDSIQPVPGATVSIATESLQTETDDHGRFGFQDLQPGMYFLAVTHPLFSPVQNSATVEAGNAQPPIVKVQMSRAANLQPFVVQQEYTGFISCSFKTANFVWDAFYCDPTGAAGIEAQDDSAHTFETGSDLLPEHYQVEIDWTANQLLSSGLVTIQCATDNTGCGSGADDPRLCNVRGPAPLVCRVNDDMTYCSNGDNCIPGGGNNLTKNGFNGLFTVGMFANCSPCAIKDVHDVLGEDPTCAVDCVGGGNLGFGLAIDQDYSIYSHVFYNYRPDADWLFVETGTVPGPPS